MKCSLPSPARRERRQSQKARMCRCVKDHFYDRSSVHMGCSTEFFFKHHSVNKIHKSADSESFSVRVCGRALFLSVLDKGERGVRTRTSLTS